MKKQTNPTKKQETRQQTPIPKESLKSLEQSHSPAIQEIVKDAKKQLLHPEAEALWRHKWGSKA